MICFSDLPDMALAAISAPGEPLLSQIIAAAENVSIIAAIAELPTKQRECATRCWLKEQEVPEVSVALSLSPVAVRKNLHYARAALRKVLRER